MFPVYIRFRRSRQVSVEASEVVNKRQNYPSSSTDVDNLAYGSPPTPPPSNFSLALTLIDYDKFAPLRMSQILEGT